MYYADGTVAKTFMPSDYAIAQSMYNVKHAIYAWSFFILVISEKTQRKSNTQKIK